MRRTLTMLLGFLALVVIAHAESKSQISQLPAGVMTEGTYTNEVVGVSYEIPKDWKATADPSGPTVLDSAHAAAR